MNSGRAKCKVNKICTKAGGTCQTKCSTKVLKNAKGKSLCSGAKCKCCAKEKEKRK